MGEPQERVVLITIRATRADDGPPVIVTREHLVWPQRDDPEQERSAMSTNLDDVVATVRDWLTEFLDS